MWKRHIIPSCYYIGGPGTQLDSTYLSYGHHEKRMDILVGYNLTHSEIQHGVQQLIMLCVKLVSKYNTSVDVGIEITVS